MNRVKKSIFAIFILIICGYSLFANPKYYYHNSKEYQLTKLITQSISINPPSIVTPVTGKSLLKTLYTIDKAQLSPELQNVYDNLVSELNFPNALFKFDNFSANIDLTSTIELNTIVNPIGKYTPDTIIYPFKDRAPFIKFDFDAAWNDTIYGKTQMMYLKCLTPDYPNSVFSTNITVGNNSTLQHIYPIDAAISFSNEYASAFLGRGKLNVGNGYTGNLFISDNFLMQDFVKFSLDSDYFDYDFTLTHFDQQKSELNFDQWMTFNGKHQLRVSHHYSTSIFNKVLISLHAGSLLQSDSALDFRMLNPFIFLHNWKGFDNKDAWQNNIMALEINAGLGLGFNMNFQFVLDQIQLSSEVSHGDKTTLPPNAFGLLLNFNHTISTKKAFIETYLETVYTMPSLYLNCKEFLDGSGNNRFDDGYNYDFILGYFSSDWTIGDISYSGHKFGPDTFALALGGKYVPYDYKWNIAYQMLFKAHGEKGIKWHNNQNSFADNGVEHIFDFGLTGNIEYLLELKTSINYSITPYLMVNSVIGCQSFWNFQNIIEKNYQNLQFSIGISFIPTKIW